MGRCSGGAAIMAQTWSYIAAGAVQTGANAIVFVPAGYAAGDLLVICLESSSALISTPTGWTAISAGNYAYAFYKFAGGSEVFTTLSGGSVTAQSVMLCYRGILGIDTSATYASASSTSVTTNTQTTTASDDLVISVFGCSANVNNTITAPGSTTTRINQSATVGSGGGLLIVDENKATAGVTTARTASFSNSVSNGCVSFSFKQSPPPTSIGMSLMF